MEERGRHRRSHREEGGGGTTPSNASPPALFQGAGALVPLLPLSATTTQDEAKSVADTSVVTTTLCSMSIAD